MPYEDGKLTPDEVVKVTNWLNEKTKNYICPVCQTNHWFIVEHVLEGRIYQGGGLVVGGPSYPTIAIACHNCYYARHFMAVPIGLDLSGPVPKPAVSAPSAPEKKEGARDA